MPRAVIYIVFEASGLHITPKLRTYFGIYTESIIEKVTSEIGYEAVLADVAYSIKDFENVGFKLKFSGYNDKLIHFVELFLKSMKQANEEGFADWIMSNAIERLTKAARNANVEVDARVANNRLLYLLEN